MTAAFLGVGLLSIVIASGFGMYFGSQMQQKIIAGQQTLIAQNAANAVQDFIQKKVDILQVTAYFSDLGNPNQESLQLMLSKLLGQEPSFRRLFFYDAQKRDVAKVSRLSEGAASQLSPQTVDDIFSSPGAVEAYIGPVYIDNITSEPMVLMAVPITDVFGDFHGVLIAEVNLKFMWDLVGSLRVGSGGKAYVVDRQGDLIAAADISRVLKGQNLKQLATIKEFIASGNAEPNENATISKGIDGADAVSHYVPLGMPDWAVVVELPVLEAYDPVIRTLELSAWGAGAGLLFSIAAALWLSKRIIRPLLKLRDAVRHIGGGKLDVKIDISSVNEIGELAEDFNSMASRLRMYTGELEAEVSERTSELNQKVSELERMNKLMVGRELRMVELKEEIKRLQTAKEV